MTAVARFRRNRRLAATRLFRQRVHPLDKFDDDEIYGKFCFRRHQIIELADEVSEQLELCNRTGGLPPILQLLLALRFYGCGTFSRCELVGVHQSTASRTISRVTKALLTKSTTGSSFPRRRKLSKTSANSMRNTASQMSLGASTEPKLGSSCRVRMIDFVNRNKLPLNKSHPQNRL